MTTFSRRQALTLAGGATLAATVPTGIAAGRADAVESWRSLVVVTANIGRDRPANRRPAIRAVRRAVGKPGNYALPMVGWQEINEGDGDELEKKYIQEFFGANFRHRFLTGEAHRIPITIPRAFVVDDHQKHFVHGGRMHVSPVRYLTEVVLHAADDPALKFVFMNMHYVAGAFAPGASDWRKSRWQMMHRAHAGRLTYWRSKGLPVIWTGDTNHAGMGKVLAGTSLAQYEHRVFTSGIDRIHWVAGTNGTKIKLRADNPTKIVDMDVDGHDARVAKFLIGR